MAVAAASTGLAVIPAASAFVVGGVASYLGKTFLSKEPFQVQLTNRQRIDAQIKRIQIAEAGDTLDFMLNAPLIDKEGNLAFVYQTADNQGGYGEPEAISPVRIQDVLDQLARALETQSTLPPKGINQRDRRPKITLKTIDLNCGQLTSMLFENLLRIGVGDFKTEILRLRQALTDPHAFLQRLRDAIVKERKFPYLKQLDLSGNGLTRGLKPMEAKACLEAIRDIVAHVKLEVLDLSDNDALGTQPLQGFLGTLPVQMASLKKLVLRNVGLQPDRQKIGSIEEEQIATLLALLKQIGLLADLDLRDNPGLGSWYKRIVRGLPGNFSLQRMLVDPENTIIVADIQKILTQRQEWFDKLDFPTEKQQAPLLQVLNTYLIGGNTPEFSDRLQGTHFSKEHCRTIIRDIISARHSFFSEEQHKGMREKLPISEAEWIAYTQGGEQLRCFYEALERGTQKVTLAFSDPNSQVLLSFEEGSAQSSASNDVDASRPEEIASGQRIPEEGIALRATPVLPQYAAQKAGAAQDVLESGDKNHPEVKDEQRPLLAP